MKVLLLSVFLLVGCFGSSAPPEWIAAYQAELNQKFTGDSGIISFEIDDSLIYVLVDSTVPPAEYKSVANAWARHFSEVKQKHNSGSNVTAYVMNEEMKKAERAVISRYSSSQGFH